MEWRYADGLFESTDPMPCRPMSVSQYGKTASSWTSLQCPNLLNRVLTEKGKVKVKAWFLQKNNIFSTRRNSKLFIFRWRNTTVLWIQWMASYLQLQAMTTLRKISLRQILLLLRSSWIFRRTLLNTRPSLQRHKIGFVATEISFFLNRPIQGTLLDTWEVLCNDWFVFLLFKKRRTMDEPWNCVLRSAYSRNHKQTRQEKGRRECLC